MPGVHEQVDALARATSESIREYECRMAEMDYRISVLQKRIGDLESLIVGYEQQLWLAVYEPAGVC